MKALIEYFIVLTGTNSTEMNGVKEEKIEHDADNGDLPPIAIEPPGKNTRIPKDPIKLVFEMILLIVAFIPMSIWAIIQHILVRRKSVEGKVVLVSIT